MEPNQIAAFKLIEQAQQAMKQGEVPTARQLAAQAAQSAPELEEVWLVMAALASPHASVAYLQRALEINPQSERAQKGMLWAQKRLQQELEKQAAVSQAAAEIPTTAPVAEEPVVTLPEPAAAVIPEAENPGEAVPEPVAATPEMEKPFPVAPAAVLEPKTSPRKPVPASRPPVLPKTIQSEKAVSARRYSTLTIPLLIVGCFVLVAVLFLVLLNTTSAAALINSNVFTGQERGPAWAEVKVVKPTASAAALEAAALPTPTPLPVEVPGLLLPPTATELPLPSETPLPTKTLMPTVVPPTQTQPLFRTETLLPTDSPTATAEVALDEGPSPTPLPTDTAAPVPTAYILPTPKPGTAGTNTTAAASGERWIDVDLTNQRVYAYEGNTLVNSFIVSTGTWQYPTVTGQYRVYIKYRYKDMSGPGYYLPNVPFTMFFYKGYAIHGTYWHSNFGTPMSHGCVNLTIPDSEWVYNFSSVGTLINIHY
jgi:lipoprotein-anchoring transpeptidase ErfK/SrfK